MGRLGLMEAWEREQRLHDERIRMDAVASAVKAVAAIVHAAGGRIVVPRTVLIAQDLDLLMHETDEGYVYETKAGQ
jgi:hypothetical protein